MTIKEFALDCVSKAKSRPMIQGEIFDLGLSKIKDPNHKVIYCQTFYDAGFKWVRVPY